MGRPTAVQLWPRCGHDAVRPPRSCSATIPQLSCPIRSLKRRALRIYDEHYFQPLRCPPHDEPFSHIHSRFATQQMTSAVRAAGTFQLQDPHRSGAL